MLVLFLARLLLLATFLLAGVSKIGHPIGTRRSLTQFGLPHRLVGPAATMLPLAELMVALGLALRATVQLAAAAALALLAVFTATVGMSLLRGRRPDCGCFGAIRPRPIGAATIVRNVALAAISIALLLFPAGRGFIRPATGSWSPAADIVVPVALALTAFTTVLLLHRRLRRLAPPPRSAAQRAGIPIGTQAPRFDLPALDGRTVSLDSLRADGTSALLVFTSPECGQCQALMPGVAELAGRRDLPLNVAVVVSGNRESSHRLTGPWPIRTVACDEKAQAARLFRITGMPSAVLIGPNGTVASHTAVGTRAVARLLAQIQPPADPTPSQSAPGPREARSPGRAEATDLSG
jgi:hypothetical protein